MSYISGLGYESWQWVIIMIVALLVGLAKTGINGAVMLAVPLLASAVSGKGSTGMMLSFFLIGDLFAVFFYRHHADLKMIKKLVPWVVTGILCGLLVGRYINDSQFQILVAICVMVCLVILAWMEIKGGKVIVPQSIWLYAITGIVCGFTSMIGNVAGPIFTIYLLAHGFQKKNFLGTVAVFFFMMNLIKLPLQIFFWHNFTTQIVGIIPLMIPVVMLGALLGYKVIKRLNEQVFRYLILGMTAAAAIKLFI